MRIVTTSQYNKDYKRVLKRRWPIDKLNEVVRKLASGEPLPPKNRDHNLSGNFTGKRECHIAPDWLLVYYYTKDALMLDCMVLDRTGSHSDIFG